MLDHPLYVNEGIDIELRKCYILLFTCAIVRAVYREITRDFSSKRLVFGNLTILLHDQLCLLVTTSSLQRQIC